MSVWPATNIKLMHQDQSRARRSQIRYRKECMIKPSPQQNQNLEQDWRRVNVIRLSRSFPSLDFIECPTTPLLFVSTGLRQSRSRTFAGMSSDQMDLGPTPICFALVRLTTVNQKISVTIRNSFLRAMDHHSDWISLHRHFGHSDTMYDSVHYRQSRSDPFTCINI
jgi:hypothetical protein